MNYLLDTNHWSYLQRRTPAIVAKIASLAPGSKLHISVISQGELVSGIEILEQGKRQAELRRFYEEITQSMATVLAIDERVAERFGKLFAELRRAGTPIVTNDIWLGASALVHDFVPVTNDAHFGFIKGLRVEDWTVA